MDEEWKALSSAISEWENRKAAVAAFRAAVNGKEEGLAKASQGMIQIDPGVARARRRELELSLQYLTRLESDAERSAATVLDLSRGFRQRRGVRQLPDLDSGVA